MRFLLGPTAAVGVLAMAVLAGCDPRKPPSTTGPQAVRPAPVARPEVDAPADPRAAVVLTPAAVTRIRAMMRENQTPYLRIRASENAGYELDLDPETDPKRDILTNSQGIDIVVDRASAAMMPPQVVVDYVDIDGVKGFKVRGNRPANTSVSLVEARKGFRTKLARRQADKAPSGPSSAYVTPDPRDGKKHPAIVGDPFDRSAPDIEVMDAAVVADQKQIAEAVHQPDGHRRGKQACPPRE